MNKKTIAIIPARGGSKRLLGKNTLLLGGIPLLAHSILYAQANAEFIDEIYVSTDDKLIKEIALRYGAKVIDRPKSLSGDKEPTVTALKHVLESLNEAVENVILLQATNPLRPQNLLEEAFEKYQQGNYDSLFTVSENHQKLGKMINDKFAPFNYKIGQRSQDLEQLYFENGLLYISKASLILENEIIGKNHFPFLVKHPFGHIDIDTQEDLDLAELILNKYKNI
ncbi:MAG: acylneuraminate cytidylyltransferase family protein [Lutibacter sp.]|jgi:N-acylneuraminate cytidylyltransferase